MDLGIKHNADFTKWVVSAGLMTEPFVVIDVGVQGGENIRWRPLGDHLVVHGFDPIEEVVRELIEENRGRSNRPLHGRGQRGRRASLLLQPGQSIRKLDVWTAC